MKGKCIIFRPLFS